MKSFSATTPATTGASAAGTSWVAGIRDMLLAFHIVAVDFSMESFANLARGGGHVYIHHASHGAACKLVLPRRRKINLCVLFLGYRIDEGEAVRSAPPCSVVPAVLNRK
jgi:hypothetical protein